MNIDVDAVLCRVASDHARAVLSTLEREETEEWVQVRTYEVVFSRLTDENALTHVAAVWRDTAHEIYPIMLDALNVPGAAYNEKDLEDVLERGLVLLQQIHNSEHSWSKYLPQFDPNVQLGDIVTPVVRVLFAIVTYTGKKNPRALPYMEFACSHEDHVSAKDREVISIHPVTDED